MAVSITEGFVVGFSIFCVGLALHTLHRKTFNLIDRLYNIDPKYGYFKHDPMTNIANEDKDLYRDDYVPPVEY